MLTIHDRIQTVLFGLFAFVIALVLMTGGAHAQPDMSPSGLFSTFVSGEGDAYSNVLLNQIFGPIFSAPDGAGTPAGQQTLFSSIVGYFNAAMLVVAGLLFFNNLVTGTVQTAHEGQVLGRNWSSLWAPLRTIFAVALLIPLPNMQGYNTAQVFVAFIAKNATQFASSVWSITAQNITTGVVPVSAPRANIPQHLASEMFLLEMCRVVLNDQFVKSASTPAQADRVVRTPTQVKNIENTVAYEGYAIPTESHAYQTRVTYDRVSASGEVITPAICGSYVTPEIPDVINNRVEATANDSFTLADIMADGNTENLRNEFQALHFRVMGEVDEATGNFTANRGLAGSLERIAQRVYANHMARAYPADGAAAPPVIDITQDLITAVQSANQRMNNGYTRLMNSINRNGTRNAAIRQAMIDRISTSCDTTQDSTCLGEGWIGAGSWYMMVARLNNEISSLFVAEGNASASSSARQDVDGRWFAWRLSDDEKALREQYTSAFEYGAEVFNTAANRMAATGWPIDPALITNIAASINGNEIKDPYSTGAAPKAKINSGILSMINYLNEQTFSQDPMIALSNVGNAMVTLGTGLIVADIFLPGDIASTVGGIIATAGATMAIILPLMPFLFWIMAVTGYFLLVVEAFIAVNLWAISHLRMDGEGMSGGVGREGWLMILALMTTPFLMIAGYLVGMIIFRISSALISGGLSVALAGLLGNSNPIFTAVATLVVGLFMVIFYMLLIERSFSLIAEFPSKVLRWMGASAHLDTSGVDRTRAAAMGAVGTFHRGASSVTKGMNYGPFGPQRGGNLTNNSPTGGGGPALPKSGGNKDTTSAG